MTKLRILMGSAAAAAFITALTALPASAQGAYGGGGGASVAPAPSGGGGGGAAVASAPSGGSSSGGSSGGSSSGGGAWGGGSSGGGSVARESGAGRYSGPTGGSGYSAPHSARTTDNGSSHSAGANGARGERGSGRSATGRTASTPGANENVPTYSRPRDGNGGTAVGTAVPRGTTPAPPGGGTIWIPGGYYPGYYPGYGYGYYDPFGYYTGFGYYGGGYYDPWYGGYPAGDTQVAYSAPSDEGSLRLKVKPREAEVYVDGYFVGVVNDFDGMFQRLHLDSGPHRVEVRAPGYETLDFDVRITADHTTTYEGELKKIQ